MHVHMSRAALSHLQIGRLAQFFTDDPNVPFIEKVAGRGSGTYNQIKKKKITDVKRGRYGSGRDATGLAYGHDNDRRQCVNLTKEGIVEIRIFQSNVSKVGFLKNIEFCDAVANFCRTASNTQLNRENFLKWMGEHRGVYPNFVQWAVREGLMTTRHHAAPGVEAPAVAA